MIDSGHRALRKGRCSHTDGIYLVTFTTHCRRRWFDRFDLGCVACRTFAGSAEAEHSELLCWVLMPDHFHALLQLKGERTLSHAVQRLKSRSTHACACIGIQRPVWARAFHDHAIRMEEDIQTVARYVIGNPIRAGLVSNVFDYPFWDAIWLR